MVRALASHQCGLRSIPGIYAICGLSLLLQVLSFALKGFSPGTLVFPSPRKQTFPNSNSTRNQVNEEPLCDTSKSLFIYFIYLFASQIHLLFSRRHQKSKRLSGTLTCIVNLRDKYEGKSYCIIR